METSWQLWKQDAALRLETKKRSAWQKRSCCVSSCWTFSILSPTNADIFFKVYHFNFYWWSQGLLFGLKERFPVFCLTSSSDKNINAELIESHFLYQSFKHHPAALNSHKRNKYGLIRCWNNPQLMHNLLPLEEHLPRAVLFTCCLRSFTLKKQTTCLWTIYSRQQWPQRSCGSFKVPTKVVCCSRQTVKLTHRSTRGQRWGGRLPQKRGDNSENLKIRQPVVRKKILQAKSQSYLKPNQVVLCLYFQNVPSNW